MRRWAAVVVACCLGSPAPAQAPITARLSTLQNPRGLDWQEVRTAHFTVIYPRALDGEARRAARLLEDHYRPLAASLGVAPRRIPVVLTNQSLTTNAYVGWAPRRTQWYAMPSPTVDAFGPMDWYRLLAVHEGRHIVQEQALRTGWVGLLSRIFGDQTMAFLGGQLYFPAWFWEGDAVGMETALSSSGRGRLPSFTGRLRTMVAGGETPAYYPTWQGSLRTLYPDWYEQGFLLTSYVRRHHGDSAWRRVLRSASWNPLPPFALSLALKRETGKGLVDLQAAALAEADSAWRVQRDAVRETPGTPRSPTNDAYHVWSLPQVAGDGSIIATYWDMDTPTQLVRLARGRREVLVDRVGLVGDLQFHVRGNQVVWSEYEVDPRYGERNYLVVKRLDLDTRQVVRLSDRSRYYGPSLSPDGARIVAVEFDSTRRTRLAFMDAESGVVRPALDVSGGHLVTPSWTPDGRGVFVVAVDTARGNALLRVDVLSGQVRTLVDFTHDAISRPVASGGYVLFDSPRDGLDNVWAVDTSSGRVTRVTSRRFGAKHASPAADGRTMVYADYGPSGWDIVEAPLDPGSGEEASVVRAAPVRLADSTVAQEARLGAALAPATHDAWRPRPYGGLRTLFDFHSLMVAPGSDGVNQGLSLESRNLLNTFGLNAGVLWNTNEQKLSMDVGASYAGLPVIVDAGMRWGSRGSSFTDSLGAVVPYSWNEQSVQLVARLPLTRLMGQRRQSLTLAAGVARTRVTDQPVRFRFDNNNGLFTPVVYSATASHVRSAAFRDLMQTGASASVVYRHTPLQGDYDSHLLAARGTAIAPGPFRNDALVLDAGHEEQRPDEYRFSSELVFPRGFSRRYHDRLTRAGASYHLPLLYPDLALGPLAFVRRIQGAGFVDVARGADRTGARVVDYRSVGGELTADIAPLGMRSTMRLGVRLSQQLTGEKRARTEFLVVLPQ
ncbi:MAG: hypothetical protein IPK85_21775 [Gemmatimonadetes bacterium]|nr:hypothetical protein [Gemmatimonadota bacterium]